MINDHVKNYIGNFDQVCLMGGQLVIRILLTVFPYYILLNTLHYYRLDLANSFNHVKKCTKFFGKLMFGVCWHFTNF